MLFAMLLSLSLLSPPSATAADTLLRCNTGGGATQEIAVVQEDGSLFLRELDTRGSFRKRSLTAAEWKNGKIRVYTDMPGSEAWLTRDPHGWFLTYKGPGYSYDGYADCY